MSDEYERPEIEVSSVRRAPDYLDHELNALLVDVLNRVGAAGGVFFIPDDGNAVRSHTLKHPDFPEGAFVALMVETAATLAGEYRSGDVWGVAEGS